MSNTVTKPNEIMLYGTRFPTFGAVRRTATTPFPPKITIGDYSRDDKIVTSSWILNDFSGGAGILHSRFPTDSDRFWYSTLETRYRNLTLAGRIHQAGTLAGPVDLITSYNERLYITVGTLVYRWSEVTKDFILSTNLNEPATSMEVFGGYLYILTQGNIHRYDDFSDTWGTFNTYGGLALVEWDGKLFRLGLDNTMYWTNDNPTIWDMAGRLHLPSGYCRQLLVYFDQGGEPAIHAITRLGVYGYEFASAKFYQTPLKFPITQSAGSGATVWRGELYVPAGQNIYKYNGTTIQTVSPTRDDGLPSDLRGNVTQVIAGHAFYYAVISTVEEGGYHVDADMFETGNTLQAHIMPTQTVTGAVLGSAQSSWHGVYDEEAGSQMGTCFVGSVENSYRIWITNARGIFYIDLPTGLHNPLQNPTHEYRRTGYLETGWTDLGWAEMDKLALSLDVRAENCTPTNYIEFYAAWDDNDEWQHVGTVSSEDRHQFHFSSEEGHVFRNMRIRIEMHRDDDRRQTPVLRSAIVGFMRRPSYLWGWTVNLNLTTGHAGKSAEELIETLFTLVESTKTAGRFVYRDDESGVLRDRRVVISNIEGAEQAGMRAKGRFTISLLQLDEVDDLGDEYRG